LKFGVGLSFYNDVDGLKLLLASIDGQVDQVLAIDGRYPGYARGKGQADLSSDGSREVCKGYDNVLLVDYPATQIQKRNKYLQLSKRHGLDFLIIIDGDEYIKAGADWATFRYVAQKRVRLDLSMYRIYDIRYEEQNGWDLGERPRLWFKPWEIRYDVKHYRWYIKAKNHLDRPVYEGNAGRALIPGLTIKHNRDIRSKERNETMNRYEDWLLQHEIKGMKRKYHLP
jgi:hypothetical protein